MAKAEVDQIAHRQRAVEATVANLAIGTSSQDVSTKTSSAATVSRPPTRNVRSVIGEVYLGELEAKAQAKSIGTVAVKLLFRVREVD